jgi:hypothetical protein
MAKKNWIYIKRGLSEDPKHREAMGMAVWLFMHICDAADFEKGIVYDWRDKEIAVDMSISTNTVRDWRARLVEKGYITCQQRQHGLEIIIRNWNNPRDYSGKKVNIQGDVYTAPKQKNNPQGESQGDTQALHPSTIESDPFIESESESESLTRGLQTDETKGQYNTERKPDLVDAILDQERQAVSKINYPKRESLPEVIRELIDEFVRVSGIKPIAKDVFSWLNAGNDWLEIGVQVKDIAPAYQQVKGYTVYSPHSITKELQRYKAKPTEANPAPKRADPQFRPMPTFVDGVAVWETTK